MNTPNQTAANLLEELEYLYEHYSNEPRATTQPYYLKMIKEQFPSYQYNPEDPAVRESLLEHVGSLPMVAISFYPHINDAEADLGGALVMLAIHDIGELATGDENTFTKREDKKRAEQTAALKLLHPGYHAAYRKVESQAGATAKFAKAIDKITPDILDYLTPADITITRLKHFVGVGADDIVPLIVKYKRPYMLWNPFMTEFHILLMAKLAAKLKRTT